jgi:predicted nucleotide-binding protein
MTTYLRLPREELVAALLDSIARSKDLNPGGSSTDAERAAFLAAFRTWDEFNKRLLERAFTPVAWHESSPKSEYGTLQDLEFLTVAQLLPEQVPSLERLAAEKARRLQSILDSLSLYWETDAAKELTTGPGGTNAESPPQTIFIVHGRDRGALIELQRFLERVTTLKIVVLGEQPNRGQTIIEKLGTHVDTGAFALVLMTADDEGRLRGEGNELGLRARQNVIFELGYAIGRLGRQHVAVLYEDGVELPSDYYGVAYIPFDATGGWKLALIGELRAARIAVDANKAV